jgi:hypothetical protein
MKLTKLYIITIISILNLNLISSQGFSFPNINTISSIVNKLKTNCCQIKRCPSGTSCNPSNCLCIPSLPNFGSLLQCCKFKRCPYSTKCNAQTCKCDAVVSVQTEPEPVEPTSVEPTPTPSIPTPVPLPEADTGSGDQLSCCVTMKCGYRQVCDPSNCICEALRITPYDTQKCCSGVSCELGKICSPVSCQCESSKYSTSESATTIFPHDCCYGKICTDGIFCDTRTCGCTLDQ